MTNSRIAAADGSSWSADGGWAAHQPTLGTWASICPGTSVRIVKRDAGGADVTAYDGFVLPTSAPAPWLEVEARWTLPRVEVAGLVFAPGDRLREFYSPLHPFNVFIVESPDGESRGWYGNVTFPAFLTPDTAGRAIVWQDLVLDAIALPGQPIRLIDDDQLDTLPSGMRSPLFIRGLQLARNDMIDFAATF